MSADTITRAVPTTRRRRPWAALGRGLGGIWPSALLATLAVVAWEIVVDVFDVSHFVIAKPSEIAEELVDKRELLLDALWITTEEIVYGFALSAVIGVLLALVVARFRWVDRALYPLIVLFQNVPKVALAPIFILWFGYGLTPKLLLVVVIAFFPITLNMRVGLQAVDGDLLLLMRSVGASRGQILRRIQIPTALPYLFAGMRIAITFCVIGAVVAEFAGASEGLGYLIQYGSTQLDTPLVFSGLTVISILGLALYYAMSALEWLVARRFPLPNAGQAQA